MMEEGEGMMEIDMDIPIAEAFMRRKKKAKRRKEKANKSQANLDDNQGNANANANEDNEVSARATVSGFDYSVENHFRALDTISMLCGEPEARDLDPAEVDRLSSSITFLREWRHFNYPSRTIRFACQNESKDGKDVMDEISLPQFSSAIVPKLQNGTKNGEAACSESSKDIVMYVGGPVWGLDWCPRVNITSESDMRSEFIAVATHPPNSSYHKIGAPLTGRGVIQIWCLLSITSKEDEPSQPQKKQKKSSRSHDMGKVETTMQKRPKGRPRKHQLNESANQIDSTGQNGQAPIQRKPRGRPRKNPVKESEIGSESNSQKEQNLSIQCLEDSSALLSLDVASAITHDHAIEKDSRLEQEASDNDVCANQSFLTSSKLRKKGKARRKGQAHGSFVPLLAQNENVELSVVNSQTSASSSPDSMRSNDDVALIPYCDTKSAWCSIPKDVSLPRMVFGLAHNGKVAWDVKWRPSSIYDKQRMGYLAVLLGNGALEVWEVPFPQTVKAIYTSCQKKSTDPRFIKLEPVFRCSTIKCGDRQSIPLTLEWSASSPHDMILAGCHDGVVALWKFSSASSSVDTRPLLCFSADTVPIRALSWAPVESYSESANVIVTAGHKGLKFWDIRDPFRPLWDFPFQKVIYSLDWLSDPRCILISVDDGTLRFISLVKAANDLPVTGRMGKLQQGFHTPTPYCVSFAIWSVQASRTGLVAYCTAEGAALRFQLTSKAVDKDPSRNRAPHFLCGSLTEEDSTLTVFTPLPDTPFPMKKSLNEREETPRSISGLLTKCNQQKRSKEKVAVNTSDERLALCYGDEQGTEFGYDDTTVVQKSKQATKLKIKSTKKSKSDKLALTCQDNQEITPREVDTQEVMPGEGDENEKVVGEVEVFPPKFIAMHRVRWNMNKGSENWLCFGGAAGILRCQKIDISGA